MPLESAYPLLFNLFDALNSSHDHELPKAARASEGLDRARAVLAGAFQEPAADEERIRILHLSDLHFGTHRAADTQNYLLAALGRQYKSIDQIVITGDLFDQPRKRHAQQFRNFANSLQLLSTKKPVVVPGNHDQRIFGNSFLGLGRRLRQIADLHWQPIVRDDEHKLIFFCFDSARGGDLARGRVDEEQLLSIAVAWETMNSTGCYDDYLKISLVHHHPYPYREAKEVPIIDPRGWVGREEFNELRGASEFLSWCAGRGVGLILHGHKHIPRLITEVVEYGDPSARRSSELTTVGCGSSLGANGGRLSFNLVDWRPAAQAWSVDFQIDRGDGQGFASAVVESRVSLQHT